VEDSRLHGLRRLLLVLHGAHGATAGFRCGRGPLVVSRIPPEFWTVRVEMNPRTVAAPG
jgi:hypothetical protein